MSQREELPSLLSPPGPITHVFCACLVSPKNVMGHGFFELSIEPLLGSPHAIQTLYPITKKITLLDVSSEFGGNGHPRLITGSQVLHPRIYDRIFLFQMENETGWKHCRPWIKLGFLDRNIASYISGPCFVFFSFGMEKEGFTQTHITRL